MHELWFWLVSVFSVSPAGIRETSNSVEMFTKGCVLSVSPAGIRETSQIGHSFITLGVGHA